MYFRLQISNLEGNREEHKLHMVTEMEKKKCWEKPCQGTVFLWPKRINTVWYWSRYFTSAKEWVVVCPASRKNMKMELPLTLKTKKVETTGLDGFCAQKLQKAGIQCMAFIIRVCLNARHHTPNNWGSHTTRVSSCSDHNNLKQKQEMHEK